MTALLTFAGGAYAVDELDRLWLQRAVNVEGRPYELVARTLVNGLCWAIAKRRYPGSLMSWVRSYAQPCNPRWYRDGDLHELHCKALEGDALDEEKRRAHMREVLHSRRSSFAPHTLEAVATALSTAWDRDWTDYAAPHVDATKKGYVPRTEPKRGENRFWTRAPGWGGYVARDTRGVA